MSKADKPIKVKAEIVEGESSADAIEVEATLIDSKKARKLLEARYEEAEKTVKDKAKVEKLLHKMEEKLAKIPNVGEDLAKLPVLAEMIWCYVNGKYADAPLGTIVASVGAVLYFVSPLDIIPDALGAVGLVDDAAVTAACIALIESDIEDFVEWRKAQQ